MKSKAVSEIADTVSFFERSFILAIIFKKSQELTPQELIEIFSVRTAVFVVEQDCPYQEVDDEDYNALHVLLVEGKLKAYARILDRGSYITFGRVLTVKEYRGEQLGQAIVKATLAKIKVLYPHKSVKISGQAYLQKFYESFGFVVNSEIYLEDGIPHLELVLAND